MKEQPCTSLIDWRLGHPDGDEAANQTYLIICHHRNCSQENPHVAELTFGALIKGEGLTNASFTNPVSNGPARRRMVSIYPLTPTTPTEGEWQDTLEKKVEKLEALNLLDSWNAHQNWWDPFWHRI
jgi:alpha-L-fucosidase 2